MRRLRPDGRAVLVAGAVAAALVPWPAPAVERWYADGVYPHLQPLLTGATNLVPFACLDVLILGAAATLAWRARRRWRAARRSVAVAIGLSTDLVVLAAGAYLAFLAAWGLNYQRPPAAVRFRVEPARVTAARLQLAVHAAAAAVNGMYAQAHAPGALDREHVAEALVPAMRSAQRELGAGWRVTPGRPKPSLVAYAFPAASVDGFTSPLGLEVILNPEILPFERPSLLAHEWAHLAGYADEREASFVGWLACLHGPPPLQYSGWLGLLVPLVRALPANDGRAVLRSLGAGPRADLAASDARLRHASRAVSGASWAIYDRYLRANRVEAGVASYGEVVRLVLGAAAAQPHLPSADAPTH